MKKFIFLIPVIFLILATTLTKNATKQLDKKIFETKENDNFYELHKKFNYLIETENLSYNI